jgi:hypothetical protein
MGRGHSMLLLPRSALLSASTSACSTLTRAPPRLPCTRLFQSPGSALSRAGRRGEGPSCTRPRHCARQQPSAEPPPSRAHRFPATSPPATSALRRHAGRANHAPPCGTGSDLHHRDPVALSRSTSLRTVGIKLAMLRTALRTTRRATLANTHTSLRTFSTTRRNDMKVRAPCSGRCASVC